MLFPQAAESVTVDGGSMVVQDQELILRLDGDPAAEAVIILPPALRDLRHLQRLAVNLRNRSPGDRDLDLVLEDAAGGSLTSHVFMYPGQLIQPVVFLAPNRYQLDQALPLHGMRGEPQPASEEIDLSNLQRLRIRPRPSWTPSRAYLATEVALLQIAAQEPVKSVRAEGFMPFVDRFGQFAHDDWPGKTHGGDQVLRQAYAIEKADLAAHPGPEHRGRFGGWAQGPRLEAAGRFRVARHDGRWWLVDPEGLLFWSQGLNCIRSGGDTGITGREDYFAWLPSKQDPLAAYLGPAWPRAGWYTEAFPDQAIQALNFFEVNLHRRDGPDWRADYPALVTQRLRSWGFNTIGAWSWSEVASQRALPYVATIWLGWEPIAGGHHQIPDPFHPDFRARVATALAELAPHSPGDPWCLGYFIDNEIKWGDDKTAAADALCAPAGQPAKQVVIDALRQRYQDIGALNAIWGTTHQDWDALAQSTEAPPEAAASDLYHLTTLIAECYFRTCREEIMRHDPDGLYLGCRFFWRNHPEAVVRAAAAHCDVLSYNRYDREIGYFQLPEGIDKPVLITEYHFGATDRGSFSPGLNGARDQEDRARLFRSFVQSALAHPQIVGAHWFALHDQPLTARPMDEENFQHGFLDVCDRPYSVLVEAARDLAATLYPLRAQPTP